jgi:ATP-dependent DNA helicase RecG
MAVQLREFERLGPEGKFIVAPEYPKLAWHEAIVNACAHRSYLLKNMSVFIRMYDDRLEVESPGGFMPMVTPENIYEVHHPRNPFLMEAMYYLRHVRCRHEGTQRMKRLMEESELPAPEFAQKEIGYAAVRVTLRNAIKQRKVWRDTELAIAVIGRGLWTTLNTPERRILNYIAETGKINTTTASQLTQLRWHAADKILKKLATRDILIFKSRYPRDSHAHYVLADIQKPESEQ